jgi:hypothetical protein
VVTCTASRSARKRTAIRLRLLRGSHQLATGRGELTGRTVRIGMRTSKALEHGRYGLRISIVSAGRPAYGQKAALSL